MQRTDNFVSILSSWRLVATIEELSPVLRSYQIVALLILDRRTVPPATKA